MRQTKIKAKEKEQKAQKERDNFFIGYQKIPNRERRLLLTTIPLLIAAIGGFGGLIAARQKKPEAATWGARAISLRGQLVKEPYPYLLVPNHYSPSGYDTVFLVKQGKHGAHQLVNELDEKYVTVSGKLLTRHDVRYNYLFEALSEVSTLRKNINIATTKVKELGTHKLRGRIIDSKCHFGVMRPSMGMTHKACASLCVRGGIPPIFVPQATTLNRVVLTTVMEDKANIEHILPYMLDLIEVEGKLSAVNNHYIFQINPATINVLSPAPCVEA